jgi:hypothetical protein
MGFLNLVASRYKIVGRDLGYISRKELQEKMPELAKAYDGTFSGQMGNKGKRPDIRITASEVFSFPQEKYSMGSWHVIFAVLNGEVKQLPVEHYFGKEQKLVPGSMILDCLVGNLAMCTLHVHPQDASPLLKEGDELTDDEYVALSVFHGMKPSGREDEFYYIKYKNDYKKIDEKKTAGEYKDAIKSLAEKGLVKVNSAGASQLTLEGKNRALQAGKVVRKLRGY